MDSTALVAAMGCTRAVADRYVVDMNAAMLMAGCTTINRAAMWCAQVGHESAGLRYFEEIASGAAYENRKDLGNTVRGDGVRFKGRGPIQLTGRLGYTQFLQWCRDRKLNPPDFLAQPEQVATSRWGFLAAAHYWTVRRPGLNGAADAGNVLLASQMVNGYVARPNGLADRQARWDRCRRLGNALLPSGAAIPAGDPAPAAPVTRTRDGDSMYFQTPQPAAGQPKWEWPTVRIPFAFEPGGKGYLKVDHGGRGGWVHLARWWLRDPNWTANVPRHFPRDHSLGSSQGRAGSERFVGYGWVTPPPDARADMIELVVSAPDGVHIQFWRTD